MFMRRRWQRILLALGSTALTTAAVVAPTFAANCGDTAGPVASRVPCACGDTVVTNTRLRASDPVVTTLCISGEALTIGADKITLDCRGLAIRGGTSAEDVLTVTAGLRGIFGERDGGTVQNCSVRFFLSAIEILGHGNRVLRNAIVGTSVGITIDGDDNTVSHNSTQDCRLEGIFLQGGRRNILWKNHITRCFDGLVIDADHNAVTANILVDNQRAGVIVEGHANLLLANQVTLSGDGAGPQIGDGFLVEGAANVLIYNIATDNEGKGFCVVPGNTGLFNVANGNDLSPQIDFDCPVAPPDSEE